MGASAYYLQTLTRTRIVLDAEAASPNLIPNDFDFRRYSLRIDREQRTFNLGLTTIVAQGAIATGNVPPQNYVAVDFGMQTYTFQSNGFNTLNENNFYGTRAAMLAIQHDFDRLLFAKSRLPLVRDLPLTLSIHGGVFWTDFANHTLAPGESLQYTDCRAVRRGGLWGRQPDPIPLAAQPRRIFHLAALVVFHQSVCGRLRAHAPVTGRRRAT